MFHLVLHHTIEDVSIKSLNDLSLKNHKSIDNRKNIFYEVARSTTIWEIASDLSTNTFAVK